MEPVDVGRGLSQGRGHGGPWGYLFTLAWLACDKGSEKRLPGLCQGPLSRRGQQVFQPSRLKTRWSQRCSPAGCQLPCQRGPPQPALLERRGRGACTQRQGPVEEQWVSPGLQDGS